MQRHPWLTVAGTHTAVCAAVWQLGGRLDISYSAFQTDGSAGGAGRRGHRWTLHSCEVGVQEGSLEVLQWGALSGACAVPSAAEEEPWY